jgi:GAF domain-containing protein
MDHGRLERLLASLYDVDDAASSVLQRICIVCADATSADGAGVSRIANGRHDPLAASNPIASAIETLQVSLAEGPCLDVVSTFRPALEPDLTSGRAAQRWPRFARAAVDQGVGAAFAFPLLTGGVAIGALDVYSTRPGDLDPDGVEDALLLADLAAIAVDRMRGTAQIAGVAAIAEAPEPWSYGTAVHNATGMVAEQLGIDVEQALLRLRAVAFATDRAVLDVARDVVARRIRIEAWVDDE